ncbi:MAG: helix-turn-helix domain-containing protein [Neptuniibacter sp.]
MSSDTSKTSKLLQVFETLTEMGFQGHSMEEIAIETGFSYAAVRRSLITLENHGWVAKTIRSSTKKQLWKPAEKLLYVSVKYKQDCLSQVHAVQTKYLDTTGEVLASE